LPAVSRRVTGCMRSFAASRPIIARGGSHPIRKTPGPMSTRTSRTDVLFDLAADGW
jgi:hypothetical protein